MSQIWILFYHTQSGTLFPERCVCIWWAHRYVFLFYFIYFSHSTIFYWQITSSTSSTTTMTSIFATIFVTLTRRTITKPATTETTHLHMSIATKMAVAAAGARKVSCLEPQVSKQWFIPRLSVGQSGSDLNFAGPCLKKLPQVFFLLLKFLFYY